MKEVPLHECWSATGEPKRYECVIAEFSGGRIIEVGVAEDGDRCVAIKRPINDEVMSVLEFALTEEAASVLSFLLNRTFHRHIPDEQGD